MRAGERADLREMREAIVTRMHDLQDRVDAGTLTDEQRYAQLRNEFGEHYHQTLAQINELLHEKKPCSLDKRLPALVGAILLLAVAVTAVLGPAATGATVAETRTAKLDVALADGQTTRLDLAQTSTITGLDLQAAETSSYTLTLEDATGKHELLKDGACTGCGETYHAPYLLSAQTDGVVHLTRISYEASR